MKRYTTIGEVREYSIAHHKMYGGRCSFDKLLEKLLKEESELFIDRQLNEQILELIPENEFKNYVDSIAIDSERILSFYRGTEILEDQTIPVGRDVTGFSHLPFVDDHMHNHNHFEINYVYSGRARQQIDTEERILTTGEICIIAPNMQHNVLIDDEESFIISILVRKSTFDMIFGNLLKHNDLLAMFFKDTLYRENQSNFLLFKSDNDGVVQKLIQDIMIESNSQLKYANEYANSLVLQLFFILMRRYSSTVLYYGQKPDAYEQNQFSMILEYVQHHYTTVTLSSLAEKFHYSESYLSRLFKRKLNMGFNKVIQNLKLEKAKELLLETHMSIAEIADYLGYESSDYFTKIFRKHYNQTPSMYRKK